ncbi:MAG: B12-binding domain-containing radical SAM protein [Calditrichaeota bacterium]|nr:B12-binding domain-containing radical SAM protein [Calditrichota bacterium]
MKVLLVVYDNASYVLDFPLGAAYIATAVRNAGHEVVIYDQAKNHYNEEHLTDYLNTNSFDVVGVGIIAGYYQYQKLKSISASISRAKQKPFYILGGHGPSPDPAFFLKKTKADAVVLGEGEITIVEILKKLEKKEALNTVKGIVFRVKDTVVINERRPLIQNIDDIPLPAYDLFDMDFYRLKRLPNIGMTQFSMSVLSGRGCPHQCNFCYRMDEGFRPRSASNIIKEIRHLQERYGVTYIHFADELFMSSEKRAIALSDALIKADLKINWSCSGRLNYAKPKVLEIMKKAGCVFINYGIESLDNKVLKTMKKGLTVNRIISGIEATLTIGISPGLNIIFGHIGDTEETLKKSVDFLLKYDDHAQLRTIRPVTPYPGSELFYIAIAKGLLKDSEDFYENKHINSDLVAVNFTDMSLNEMYNLLLNANTTLINSYFSHKKETVIEDAKKLYLKKNTTFRGFRQT